MSAEARFRIPKPEDPGPRPREIHRHPCARCPSAHYPPDPQALDYLTAPREVQLREGIFPCAWRPEKLCKGVCDRLGVREEDLMSEYKMSEREAGFVDAVSVLLSTGEDTAARVLINRMSPGHKQRAWEQLKGHSHNMELATLINNSRGVHKE